MEEPLNIERDVVKNGVRLDCVFEGYEYRSEREEVRSQRLAGFECVEIAENTGLSLEQVTDYCRELGLPEYLVMRQPFPGPGLGIRIIGEVTPEKVAIVQDADAIWREEIAKAGLDKEISQYYAALTNMHSVGVMGDERTYDYAVALRAVTTTDFMTAESYNMPWDVLGTVTSRIVNEVKHVNRVFYDCTGKPPATIELE